MVCLPPASIHIIIRCAAHHPYVPLPALVGRLAVIEINQIRLLKWRNLQQRFIYKIDYYQTFDGGRMGVWGRAAQSRDANAGLFLQYRKTLRTAPPPAAFFGSFLVRTQEMNT